MNPLPVYTQDMTTHAIYRWPPHVTIHTPQAVHAFLSGPHGPVFAQGIGLPALLAPFMALGSVTAAVLGYFWLLAVGVVCLHQRASRLGGLGRGGRIVFALSLAAPALWLASTQIYPDLLAGLLLASAFIELAIVEREGALGRPGTAIIAIGLVIAPWLHIKNLLPVVIALIALAVLSIRTRPAVRRLVCSLVLPLMSIACLSIYNWCYFGRIGGLPQAGLSASSESGWHALALLVDRHQGLVIQVPTVLFGLVGLALAVHRLRVSVVGTCCAVAALLLVNASYLEAPFGGTSFAGRFQWTIAPMVLAWGAVAIGRIQTHRRRLVVTGAAIGVLWAAQFVPIVEDHHQYFNDAVFPFRPWDPALNPGWWGVFDRYLPNFIYPRGATAGGAGAVVLVALLVVLSAWLIIRACRPTSFGWKAAVAACLGIVLVAGALGLSARTVAIPASPLTWPGKDLSSPWVTGATPVLYRPVPLVDLGPGTYVAKVAFRAVGDPIPGSVASINLTPLPGLVVSHWLVWSHPTDAQLIGIRLTDPTGDTVRTLIPLRAVATDVEHAEVAFSTTEERAASFQLLLPPHGHLQILQLSLAKTSGSQVRGAA